MLEYFAASMLAEHLRNKKQKEDTKYESFNTSYGMDYQSSDMSTINLIAGVIAIVIAILTARLAYDCNKRSDVALRLLSTIFAFFFSGMYLLYYFLRYVLMNGKC